MHDEGSFAAGRQALLDALQTLEQRAHERAERTVRDAERTARQLTLESEQRAYQLTTEAEERARQATLEAASRIADLEQQLSQVHEQLEAARATLNTLRQQLMLSTTAPSVPQTVDVAPALNGLRATVDALKRSRAAETSANGEPAAK